MFTDLIQPSVAKQERKWTGQNTPSLETLAGTSNEDEDVFDEEFLEYYDYDIRRLILARDPLCAVDAFTVTFRVALAKTIGYAHVP